MKINNKDMTVADDGHQHQNWTLRQEQWLKPWQRALVITNQIESTNDWKYSESGTDIGIVIAWVMKSSNNRDVRCDEDGQHAPSEESQKKKWELLMITTTTRSKLLDKNDA